MVYDIIQLTNMFSDYANVYEKICTEEKRNRLIKIKRGLYSDSKNENKFFIGNVLYSPSYISFETALSFYELIPERVVVTQSATYKKNKIKKYTTPFGTFIYQDINVNVYPFGINMIEYDGQIIQIASKEKALTDTISTISPRKSMKEIKDLLFDDLRINENEFDSLNKETIIELCDLYQSVSLKNLKKYLRKEL